MLDITPPAVGTISAFGITRRGRLRIDHVTPTSATLPPTAIIERPIVDFCRREKVARAYLVSPENKPLAVARFPGVDTAFLRIPAHVLTYFLGREETRIWKA